MAHRSLLASFGCWTLLLSGLSGGSFAQEPAAAPVAVKGAVPFLYQIDGKGTSGFLYGTVHLPDKRVVDLPASVVTAFQSSDRFYAEIEATAASEAKVQKMAQLPAGTLLNKIVGPETWSRIEARFIKAGQPAAMALAMAPLEPWAFSSLLPMLDYLEELMTQPPLDKMLYQRAIKAGKAVAGLETVEEQVAVFQSFSRDEQIQMLRDSLDLLDQYEAEGRNIMEEMVAAWMSGDSASLVQLLDDGFGTDPAIRERAEQELLWKRNTRFAERMEAQMTAHPAETLFFAIGALHLPDAPALASTGAVTPDAMKPDAGVEGGNVAPKLGVVALLRERGYTVTRVGAGKPARAGATK